MEEIVIRENGREIYSVWEIPKSSEKVPIVIFSHGYNGSYKHFERHAAYLAERGIASVRFDFCGGSVTAKSSMKTTEMTLFTEKADLISIVKAVQANKLINPNFIFLHGESQGGLVSALVAAELKEEIKGLVLIYPALCIPDNWNERFKEVSDIPESITFWDMTLGKNFFLAARELNVYKVISGYEGPVLIIHGDEDKVVPVSYSEKASHIYKNVELLVLEGEGHGFSDSGVAKTLDYEKKRVLSM